ncbi:MAG: hypothetical protein RIS09_1190 [Actinomycetota bacterium]|jgi:hypothetical protein
MKLWHITLSIIGVWLLLFFGQYRIAAYILALVCCLALFARLQGTDFEVRSKRFDVIALAGLALSLAVFGFLVP